MTDVGVHAGELVRARVADADRLRRAREAARRLWRLAPAAAGAGLAIAAIGRVAGWANAPIGTPRTKTANST